MYKAKIRLEDYQTGEIVKFEGKAHKCLAEAINYLQNKDEKRIMEKIIQAFEEGQKEFDRWWKR
jgi:cellobiose-specific phosphotransferase system component IIA